MNNIVFLILSCSLQQRFQKIELFVCQFSPTEYVSKECPAFYNCYLLPKAGDQTIVRLYQRTGWKRGSRSDQSLSGWKTVKIHRLSWLWQGRIVLLPKDCQRLPLLTAHLCWRLPSRCCPSLRVRDQRDKKHV